MKNYRKKIYKYYANSSGYDLAPSTVQGFNQRESFFKYSLVVEAGGVKKNIILSKNFLSVIRENEHE